MASKSSSSKSSAPAAGSSAANRAQIIARQTTGMAQGSSTPSSSQATAALASGSNSVKPSVNSAITALNSMSANKTTPKIDPATGRLTTPMEMQAYSPAGGGGAYQIQKDTLNPSNVGKVFSGGKEVAPGSEILKLFESASSPFNIAAAQKNPSIQAQIQGLKGGRSKLNFDYNPSASGGQPLMKTTVTPQAPAPTSLSKTDVTIGNSLTNAKNFTQYYNQNKATGKTIDELRQEWEAKNGAPAPKAPEQPKQPEKPKEQPQEQPQEEPIQVPNTPEGIQSAILQAIQPSQEEQTIQAQIDKEMEALNQGLVDVEDRPVALPFITGMSTSLEKRNALRVAPLQNKLTRMQNARLGKLQALQTQLGFKNEELTRNFQKTSNDFNNKVTLATKGLRYDPATDKFFKDESLASASMDPLEKAKLEQGLRKEYSDESKNFQTVRDYYARMLKASEDPSAAGDIAIIFSYMKVLDPTSVVREGEFATAANAGSVPDSIRNMWNKALTGERIAVNRQDFINQAGNMFNAANQQQEQRIKTYNAIANSAGVSPENVVMDIGLAPEIAKLIGTQATGPQDFQTDTSAGGGQYPTVNYPDVNSKIQSAMNDIRAGYSKKQIQDYYHLTDAQYLQLTQQL